MRCTDAVEGLTRKTNKLGTSAQKESRRFGYAVRCAAVALPRCQRPILTIGLRPSFVTRMFREGRSPGTISITLRRGTATAAHQTAQPRTLWQNLKLGKIGWRCDL